MRKFVDFILGLIGVMGFGTLLLLWNAFVLRWMYHWFIADAISSIQETALGTPDFFVFLSVVIMAGFFIHPLLRFTPYGTGVNKENWSQEDFSFERSLYLFNVYFVRPGLFLLISFLVHYFFYN